MDDTDKEAIKDIREVLIRFIRSNSHLHTGGQEEAEYLCNYLSD